MTFASPPFLWLAAILGPLTAAFLWWTWRRKQKAAAQFVGTRLYQQLTIGVSPTLQIVRRVLFGVAVLALLIALARPRWGFIDEETTSSGVDVIVAFDVSRSMLATDATPNRLEKARRAALDLVESSQTDRLGLVAFAGDAFLQAPLTLDDEAFRQSVRALDTDLIPVQGTGLAAALREARAGFGKDSTGAKAVVVITDGEDHEPGAIELAREMARDGIRVFTLGVGTTEGAVLRTADPYGNPVFIKDQQGNAVKSRLNETLLREVADAGGGFYLPLQNRQTIQNLYEQGIGPLPRTQMNAGKTRQWIERFQWPLAVGILLLMAEVLVPEHRRRIAPRNPTGILNPPRAVGPAPKTA
ncbi:MAG: VWA domain-containing protein [Verrucomicrobia bacterium]|nr:VWA domain-containing protein [Verrucomicrobiota bacterium]